MLEVLKYTEVASRKACFYDVAMALCNMGNRLIGPLPIARLVFKYAVIAVNYFTKWVEAKPLATISSKKVQNFIWEAIICRFGIPHEIISDNRAQFDSREFKKFCSKLGIKKSFSSVDHP